MRHNSVLVLCPFGYSNRRLASGLSRYGRAKRDETFNCGWNSASAAASAAKVTPAPSALTALVAPPSTAVSVSVFVLAFGIVTIPTDRDVSHVTGIEHDGAVVVRCRVLLL